MTTGFTTAFADAWTAWRRDAALLLPLAGLTMFVPQYAVLLLVPSPPAAVVVEGSTPTGAEATAWADAVVAWAGQHGIWYALAPVIGLIGTLAIMALHLDHGRPTLGRAIARGAFLCPRYLLSSMLVAVPVVGIMLPAAASRVLLAVLVPLDFYVLGRSMLAGPVIVGQAPVGAVAAIRRSWALTRGQGWMLGATYAVVLIGAQLIGSVFLSLAELGAGRTGVNPVVAAVFDGAAALVTTAAALAIALVEVALYRRLARTGT